jgi:hypothetical protein
MKVEGVCQGSAQQKKAPHSFGGLREEGAQIFMSWEILRWQRDISVMEYPKGESGSEHRKGAKRIPGGGRECLGARGSAANTASGKALAMKGCPFAGQKV